MLKLIVFDWDDTITIGAIGRYVECYKQTLRQFGSTHSDEQIHATVLETWGIPHKEVLAKLLDKADQLKEADRIYSELTERLTGDIGLLPGTRKVLTELAKKYRLIVVSNSMHTRVLRQQQTFGLTECFTDIISMYDFADFAQRKAAPDMLNQAMESAGVTGQETLAVGDAPVDVAMAKAAGVPVVITLTGILNKEAATKLEVPTIKDLTELPNYIQTHY